MKSKGSGGGRMLNVLFIGNSFTTRNDLPGLIARLATASGGELRQRVISAGGASLRAHWNKGEALRAIQDDRYDWVVLQEQSTLPIKNPARMQENIRLFDEAIRAAGSRTALYLTWARQHAPHTQKNITDAYVQSARAIGATLIPAGVAWEKLLREHDRPILHDKDKSHPTPAGSYLAACVFFTVLFDQSPVGLTADIEGLGDGEAELLQRTAQAAIDEMKPHDRHLPKASASKQAR